MPRYDFWNNPLVVTAFRLKYRRGSLGASTTLYLLALVGLGGLLHRYWDDPATPWIRAYLVCLLGLQFVYSGFGSAFATGRSLNAEVNQRTLDFQRITTLGPRQILLGKLLGEPANSYLLAISILPLVAWCGLAGAASADVIAWFCLQLMTFCLMMGVLGLMQPLEPAANKGSGGNHIFGIGFVVIVIYGVLAASVQTGSGRLNPCIRMSLGIITPIIDLAALYRGQPKLPAVQWFSVDVPCLWIAPLAQLAIAGVVLGGVARKLLNPTFSLLSKPVAYAIVVGIDVLIAGSIYVPAPGVWPLDKLTATFVGAHLAVALVLLLDLTPGKPGLLSWLWRFRGRQSWLASSLLGDRGENSLVALAFALLGVIDWLGLVWLPAFLAGTAPALDALEPETLHLLCGGTLLLLALAIALQWIVLIAPKSGAKLLAINGMIAILAPAIAGHYCEIPWLQAASPLAQLIAWSQSKPLPIFPMYLAYGLLLCGSWLLLRRRLSAHAAIIDRKLAKLTDTGAAPAN